MLIFILSIHTKFHFLLTSVHSTVLNNSIQRNLIQLSGDDHRVQISGVGLKFPVVLTLQELKTKYEIVSVSAALQCAGNRRADMSKFKAVRQRFQNYFDYLT